MIVNYSNFVLYNSEEEHFYRYVRREGTWATHNAFNDADGGFNVDNLIWNKILLEKRIYSAPIYFMLKPTYLVPVSWPYGDIELDYSNSARLTDWCYYNGIDV